MSNSFYEPKQIRQTEKAIVFGLFDDFCNAGIIPATERFFGFEIPIQNELRKRLMAATDEECKRAIDLIRKRLERLDSHGKGD